MEFFNKCFEAIYWMILKKREIFVFVFYTVEDVIKVSVVPVVTKSEGKLTQVDVALLPLRGWP